MHSLDLLKIYKKEFYTNDRRGPEWGYLSFKEMKPLTEIKRIKMETKDEWTSNCLDILTLIRLDEDEPKGWETLKDLSSLRFLFDRYPKHKEVFCQAFDSITRKVLIMAEDKKTIEKSILHLGWLKTCQTDNIDKASDCAAYNRFSEIWWDTIGSLNTSMTLNELSIIGRLIKALRSFGNDVACFAKYFIDFGIDFIEKNYIEANREKKNIQEAHFILELLQVIYDENYKKNELNALQEMLNSFEQKISVGLIGLTPSPEINTKDYDLIHTGNNRDVLVPKIDETTAIKVYHYPFKNLITQQKFENEIYIYTLLSKEANDNNCYLGNVEKIPNGYYYAVSMPYYNSNLKKELIMDYYHVDKLNEKLQTTFVKLIWSYADMVSQRIYHQDIKLDNLICKHMDITSVKIIDFNISRSPMYSPPGRGIGTAGYMAPERDDDTDAKTEIDPEKADVFSLGMVFFYMINGKESQIFQNLNDEYNELIKLVIKLESHWAFIPLRKMLEKDPAERPTFQELKSLFIKVEPTGTGTTE